MKAVDTSPIEMTQVQYARHRGVSKQAINQLVRDGKIPVIERNGRKLIDAAMADRALGATCERINTPPDDEPARAAAKPMLRETAGLTQARTATEIYTARLKQLEYDERVGTLVKADQLEAAALICGEAVIRALELPLSRIDMLTAAALKGASDLRGVIKDIIREQRVVCSTEFSKLAAGGAPADVQG
jgi:hypothetical protein